MSDRVAVDTSVAIPLLLGGHPHHRACRLWRQGRDLSLSGHAAFETYSVLTRLPAEHTVDGPTADLLIRTLFREILPIMPAGPDRALAVMSEAGVAGGAVYDALVALTAREHGLPLATRDQRARGTYERLGVQIVLVS